MNTMMSRVRGCIVISMVGLALLSGCSNGVEPTGPVVSTMAAPNSRVMTDTFRTETTFTILHTQSNPYLTSVIMSFYGGAKAITWNIDIIQESGSITNHMIDFVGNGETFTWFLPSRISLSTGDEIVINNGVIASAYVRVSLEM